MESAENENLKERKFGYAVLPPPPHPPCPHPPHPPHHCIPAGMTVRDWINYINSYIDVRARQLYDKLKDKDVVKDFILLKDQKDDKVYEVYIYDGALHSRLHN